MVSNATAEELANPLIQFHLGIRLGPNAITRRRQGVQPSDGVARGARQRLRPLYLRAVHVGAAGEGAGAEQRRLCRVRRVIAATALDVDEGHVSASTL